MSKHRKTMFAVVREKRSDAVWEFSGLIGVYVTLQRAEEVESACRQEMRERGFDDFSFRTKPVTFYDE